MNYHLLSISERLAPNPRAGVARRRRARSERHPRVADGGLPRARGVRPDGDPDRRAPEPEADPARRRLGRAPAAQGLSARRRAGALQRARNDGDCASQPDVAQPDLPRHARPEPDADRADDDAGDDGDRRRPDDQLRPEPSVDPRRAPPDRRPLRRGRDGRRGGHRLPPHRLREEHGAQDVVEVHHVPRAHRLRLLPEQRVRLRRRRREAARARGAREGHVDAHAPLRAEPHPLAPRLARHVARWSWVRSRCSGTRSASASRSSTCSSS